MKSLFKCFATLMNTRLPAFVFLLLLGLTSHMAPAHAFGASSPPLRVLFLGNSYTYVNMLPEMLQQMALAGKQRPLEYRMIAPGGYTLEQHWNNEATRKAIAEGKWDYVVLQEQSLRPLMDAKGMFAYARRLDQEVRKSGAKTIFYMTWSRKAAPEKQPQLSMAYSHISKELKAITCPVGLAWAKIIKQNPNLELFNNDGSHPSPAGTYLGAAVFYSVLYNANPVGLPGTLSGKDANGKMETWAALSKEESDCLQNAALQTIKEYNAAVPQ